MCKLRVDEFSICFISHGEFKIFKKYIYANKSQINIFKHLLNQVIADCILNNTESKYTYFL